MLDWHQKIDEGEWEKRNKKVDITKCSCCERVPTQKITIITMGEEDNEISIASVMMTLEKT